MFDTYRQYMFDTYLLILLQNKRLSSKKLQYREYILVIKKEHMQEYSIRILKHRTEYVYLVLMQYSLHLFYYFHVYRP